MSSNQYGRKPIWCDPVDLSLDSGDSDDEDAPLPPPPAHAPGHLPRPRMYNFPPPPPKSPPPSPSSGTSHLARAAACGAPAPSQGGGAAAQPFRIYPSTGIIFQPDPSSSTSSSGDVSDSSDTGTDRSGSEKLDTLLTAAIAATSTSSTVVPSRILKRMSSVTLVEDDAAGANGRRVKPATASSGSSTSPHTSHSGAGGSSDSEEKMSPVSARESRSASRVLLATDDQSFQYDTDDELRYMREVEGSSPIPLSCTTQERVHHPRRRPASSPAAGMRGQQTNASSGTEHSWKRLGTGALPVVHTAKTLETHDARGPSARRRDDYDVDTAAIKREQRSVPTKSPAHSSAHGTLLVYQPTCLDHHNDTHQENRQRLGVLCGPDGVLHKERFTDLTWAHLNELKPARLNDMLRVHSFEYIQHLERACGLLPDQDAAISVGALYESSRDRNGVITTLTYSDWLKVHLRERLTALTRQDAADSRSMSCSVCLA